MKKRSRLFALLCAIIMMFVVSSCKKEDEQSEIISDEVYNGYLSEYSDKNSEVSQKVIDSELFEEKEKTILGVWKSETDIEKDIYGMIIDISENEILLTNYDEILSSGSTGFTYTKDDYKIYSSTYAYLMDADGNKVKEITDNNDTISFAYQLSGDKLILDLSESLGENVIVEFERINKKQAEEIIREAKASGKGDDTYNDIFKEYYSYQEYLKVKAKIESYGTYASYVKRFSEGLAPIERYLKDFEHNEMQYGYIDIEGNIVIPFNSDWKIARDFNEGIAFVEFNSNVPGGNTAIIDKTGKELARFDSYSTGTFSEGVALFTNKENTVEKLYMIDTQGNIKKLSVGYATNHHKFKEGLCCVYDYDNRYYYINKNGQIEIDLSEYKTYSASDFENGQAELIMKGADKEYYTVIIDRQGNIISKTKKQQD